MRHTHHADLIFKFFISANQCFSIFCIDATGLHLSYKCASLSCLIRFHFDRFHPPLASIADLSCKLHRVEEQGYLFEKTFISSVLERSGRLAERRDSAASEEPSVFPEQPFPSKLLVMSTAVRYQLLSGKCATVSPILHFQRIQQPSPSLNPFITLRMPLTGQAHLQQVEGRLICLCTEAKEARGSKNEQKKRRSQRWE